MKHHTSRRLLVTTTMGGLLCLIAAVSQGQVSSGSGTSGKIPVWTGTHSQGNSVITQSAGKIGIGTTAPSSPFTVENSAANPAIYARGTTNGHGVRGDSVSGAGLYGASTDGNAVVGTSLNRIGFMEFIVQQQALNRECGAIRLPPIQIQAACMG